MTIISRGGIFDFIFGQGFKIDRAENDCNHNLGKCMKAFHVTITLAKFQS